jgi:hypothetical protein
VCRHASKLRIDDDVNSKLTSDDFASQWRYSVKGIMPQLHAAGIDWVEQTERKLADGTVSTGYKLTKYGRNISSDASQCGQYAFTPNHEIDARKLDSLQECRKAIKAAKEAEALAAETDTEREMREVLEQFDTGVKLLRDLLVDSENPESVREVLTGWIDADGDIFNGIDAMRERNTVAEVEAEAPEVEAEAEAEAA